MPRTHTRDFRIRHYECDAFGQLNNANYVRYMQETAFDASADAGYDQERYNELGHYWLIRETEIEYLRPVHYGDTIAVKTWVIDFHRVRSRRTYEFTHKDSSELVARGVTDWVYLDNQLSRPTTIPDEIINAFLPEGPPSSFPPRKKFPNAPPPPPGRFEMDLRVALRDLDAVQHVNNAVYLSYVEECGMQAISAHGWPITRMVNQNFAIVVRKYQILYRQPAFLDDELVISTWISNVQRSTATRHYIIQRKTDAEQLAIVHSFGEWVNLDSGRPIRIPNDLLSDFRTTIVT